MRTITQHKPITYTVQMKVISKLPLLRVKEVENTLFLVLF